MPTPIASFVVTRSDVPARLGDVQDVTPVVETRRKPVAITAAVIEARIERINSRRGRA